MHHFQKKNSKKFLPRGALQNVWRPRENVSSGPTVALDRPDKARSQISTFSWLRDQPFLNCKWRYYVKSAPYAVGGSTFLCYLIELATGYCWSTVLYLALFGTTLQNHFMKGFFHWPTSGSLQMLHETWSLIAISRGHNDPAPVSGPRMCELSSVQICNFVCYSLANIGTGHSFCFILSILLSLYWRTAAML